MYLRYFPTSDAQLALWCKNYKEKIVLYGTALGMTQVEVDLEIALCDKIIDSIDDVEASKAALNSAFKAKETVVKRDGGTLRKTIANHKTEPGYTIAIGENLGIVGSSNDFIPSEYKPEIFVSLYGGKVRVRFVKRGVNGINLYKRTKGDTQWVLVSRVTKSPYLFQPVVLQDNVPAHFEFRAFGVLNDEEIGMASDISEILFGA